MSNIQEVMKFYNLGDKTFEADFNTESTLSNRNCNKCVAIFV